NAPAILAIADDAVDPADAREARRRPLGFGHLAVGTVREGAARLIVLRHPGNILERRDRLDGRARAARESPAHEQAENHANHGAFPPAPVPDAAAPPMPAAPPTGTPAAEAAPPAPEAVLSASVCVASGVLCSKLGPTRGASCRSGGT